MDCHTGHCHEIEDNNNNNTSVDTTCVTTNVVVNTNDTVNTNVVYGDSIFRITNITHRSDTVSTTVCVPGGEPTVAHHAGPSSTDTYNTFQGTNGGGTGGNSNTWVINTSDLGLYGSTWVQTVAATKIINTGTCWKTQSDVMAVNLSETTWASMHNDAITGHATRVIIRIAGTNQYGEHIIAVDSYIDENSMCQQANSYKNFTEASMDNPSQLLFFCQNTLILQGDLP